MEITRSKYTSSNIDNKRIINLNEGEIISKYSTAFTILTKRLWIHHVFVCLSCEKLCFQRNIVDGTKFRKPLSGTYWKRLINYLNIDLTNTFYICKYCLYFHNSTLLSTYFE